MDSCLVIPWHYLHPFQQYLAKLHVTSNKDFLLQDPPLWLQYFGAFEVVFQLPVFFIAAYSLYKGRKSVLVVMAIYGFNAFFTTGVCLLYVLAMSQDKGLRKHEMWNLFALYVPYFIIPLVMMIDCMFRAMKLISAGERVFLEKKNH